MLTRNHATATGNSRILDYSSVQGSVRLSEVRSGLRDIFPVPGPGSTRVGSGPGHTSGPGPTSVKTTVKDIQRKRNTLVISETILYLPVTELEAT